MVPEASKPASELSLYRPVCLSDTMRIKVLQKIGKRHWKPGRIQYIILVAYDTNIFVEKAIMIKYMPLIPI